MVKKTNDLGLISKYRGELMGVAILLVLTFHAFLYTSAPDLLKTITGTGKIGVDIFLILSAVGLYFSIKKKPRLISFYKKRVIRILPTYFLLAFPYFLYTAYTKHTGLAGFCADITFYTSWLGGDNPYYFIELILICYIIMPLLYHLSEYKWGLAFIMLLCCLCYYLSAHVGRNEVVVNRIPIFAINVVGAKWVYRKVHIPYLEFGSLFLMISIIFIANMFTFSCIMVDRIIYSIFSIPFLITIAILLDSYKLDKLKKMLRFCGTITLEIYMINFPVIALLTRMFDNVYLIACLTFVITIGLSYFAHQVIDKSLSRVGLIT